MKHINRIAVFILFTLSFSQTAIASTQDSDEMEKIQSAMNSYAKAIPLDILSPERAQLLTDAADILNKVIEKNPKSLDAHRKLMGVYLLKQDYSNGIRVMKDAIILSPNDPKLFISLAFLYEHSGALHYAKEILEQALVLDPNQEVAKDYMLTLKHKIKSLEMNPHNSDKNIPTLGQGQNSDKPTHSRNPH